MSNRTRLLGVAFALLAACSSVTEVADATLDLDAAHARWMSTHPASYTFDFNSQGSAFPTPEYYRVEVTNNRITAVTRLPTGEPVVVTRALSIDDLWVVLTSARARGEPLSSLEFSSAGVPLLAVVGSFANDSGTSYRIRNYTPR